MMKQILSCLLFLCFAVQAKQVNICKIESPLVQGVLYQSSCAADNKYVIVIGGSGGRVNESYSQLIAEHCQNVLAIAYFNAAGFSDTLDDIPIERVSDAIDFLQSGYQKGGLSSDAKLKISVVGISRGSELALWSAATDHRVGAVIGIVPSSVTWHGQRTATAWRYQNNAIASLSFARQSETPIYQRASNALQQLTSDANEFIPVEQIKADILLISAENDHIWPSKLMSQQIVKRLQAHNFSYQYLHLSVEDDHFFDEQTKQKLAAQLLLHLQ
ncbi:acyl-CoA thioester hydrolase/BAAT C-terminal domain-containing protein [Thalassotalea sp. Y01]|uniref:acyl-CoA thioester hydrolase/BAAT C-terminal domain-containing protein n=1 Tax=Thalassotalea sp. Y01 TaxID=2729613 RepID=UPI00145D44F8|nr:acyl-CoA thioester hydrolase/BAAT C-terminal domain-containing protein [Thalassotalea sp. Y01]NMP16670.1 hypothetical protein [Thalassotalea sp. Y01]